jgi:bifunctional ADP-heptose synthase (sugar kinase/adenylyltransferase)
MGFVDLVVLFGEPTPETLIEAIQPDILTKGDDYSVENIVGAKFVIDRGGEVVTLPLVKGHSTSQLVNRILTQS